MLARPATLLARASVVAAALLAASPAAAQRAPAARPKPAAPAPSSVAVPVPPPPAGTSLVAQGPERRRFQVAGLLGLASPRGNGGDGSLMMAVDASLPWRTTPGGLALGVALPVRLILLSSGDAAGVESGGVALEATPGLRASIPLGRSRFSFRTDAGVGVVARSTWVEADVTFVGRRTQTSDDVTGIARIGFSLDYALRPGVSIAIEPLSFGFDLDGNADWIFAAGASFRL